MTKIKKKTTIDPWHPPIELKWYFTPTTMQYSEIRKARIKNYNLPILQYMYNGDWTKPLRCMLSGEIGWKMIPCRHTKKPKQRFNLDFNHIRQEQSGNKSCGTSKDKGKYSPSGLLRGFYLDNNVSYLLEFMTMMPLTPEHHGHISQDSASGHLSLLNFSKSEWPWVLQKKRNFNRFCDLFEIKFDYSWFIDHLSDIRYPSIHVRMQK